MNVDQARTLRECAVDLIRASDLCDGSPEARESAVYRVHNVVKELQTVESWLAVRARQKCSSAVWRAKNSPVLSPPGRAFEGSLVTADGESAGGGTVTSTERAA